jgi:hypothetical protein
MIIRFEFISWNNITNTVIHYNAACPYSLLRIKNEHERSEADQANAS